MKESEYILLLSKRFSGDLSPAESTLLDEWLRQSPENEQFAQSTQRIWERSEGYARTFSPDLSTDFQKVQARIQATAVPPSLRATLGQRLVRVAAVIALLLSSVWGWQQFSGSAAAAIMVSADNTGMKDVRLPDGSQIWLRQGSQLEYASQWTGESREVKLRGEAYFEIQHDAAHPFKVMLENGGTVEVLGTQFNVRQSSKQTEVLVRSGKVRFSPSGQTAGPVLTAHQKAIFDQDAAQMQIATVASLNELSWQTGGLEFVNTPLLNVVRDLEQYYGVRITLSNPAMSSCPHSAPLTHQSIEKVLETIALTHQLKVKKTGEAAYELSAGQCH